MPTPAILLISLSPIDRDSRVLRQLSVVKEFGHVTTVGYGPAPQDSDEHIEVPPDLKTLPQSITGVARLAARRLRSAELAAPAVQWVLKALRGRRFDAVVANEARILALADAVAHGSPIWADMHEWAPEERTHIASWRLLVAPLMDHLCRTYLPRCQEVTAVGGKIAALYDGRYGIRTTVMRNSARWQDLAPTAVIEDRVRLVHSGAAVAGRNLELMIDTVMALPERFTLDLYLVPGNDNGAYLRTLRSRAEGSDRVRFHPPVAPAELPATLNAYDLGVFWIEPFNTNARLTLPNKFFDYVQGRLGIAIGPSVEMEPIVREHDLGPVARGFSRADCVASLHAITAEDLRRWKAATDGASRELSFDTDAEVARRIMRNLLAENA
ncbi:hypothetical protein [Brachybacterium sp. p3-SID957]|uniref:hypothetical protein n=1 Tax=Brachybacterium sp. p3-SID957 TaxID=2916049 RepID=UPI00223B5BD0|nr:hypothetical protein [Brachybacterium sp. p3-SID957]MCT1775057.1 hypothetical protein [Brachybacterium sp. p3-SID957]